MNTHKYQTQGKCTRGTLVIGQRLERLQDAVLYEGAFSSREELHALLESLSSSTHMYATIRFDDEPEDDLPQETVFNDSIEQVMHSMGLFQHTEIPVADMHSRIRMAIKMHTDMQLGRTAGVLYDVPREGKEKCLPFNVDLYNTGKYEVMTRDGREVEKLQEHKLMNNDEVGRLIMVKLNGSNKRRTYTVSGKWIGNVTAGKAEHETDSDLVLIQKTLDPDASANI